MSKFAPLTAALVIVLGAAPAFAASSNAANPPPANSATAPANPTPANSATATANPPPSHPGTATVSNASGPPSQRNPLLADNGDVRISKLVGTNVYNEQDQKLGSVNDVLMGSNGQPDVILSTNGKLVEVPWNKLEFGDAKLNSDNKVIMKGETQQSLKQMPQFKYTAKS